MAVARTSVRSSSRQSPLARPAAGRSPAGRVRWDRLGRVALLVVLLGVVLLYVGPARSWFSTWGTSKAKHAQVEQLRAEHARLEHAVHALHQPATLMRRAREMGMVKPGERAYVVRGLPGG